MSNGFYISPENEHKIRRLINEYAPRPYPTKPVPTPSRNDDKYYVVCGAVQDAYPMYLGTIQVFDSFNRSWTSMTANDVYLIDSRQRDLTVGNRYECNLMGLHSGKGLFMTEKQSCDGYTGTKLDYKYECAEGGGTIEYIQTTTIEDGCVTNVTNYVEQPAPIPPVPPPDTGSTGSEFMNFGVYTTGVFPSLDAWAYSLNYDEAQEVAKLIINRLDRELDK